MSLSTGDKAECKEIAREIIQEVIKIHIELCPHGRSIVKLIWVSVGIALGSGVAGGSIVLTLAKVFGT